MSNSFIRWDVVYKSAILENGELLFPERLTKEFLDNARRVMGSYVFSNQYLNQVIPEDSQVFKKQWFRYFSPYDIPDNVYHFAFVDPAISKSETSDYTAICVVAVDEHKNWYVKVARRYKVNPTELINEMFKIHAQFKCQSIGVEDVAFQKSIIHFATEESRRRGVMLPITGIKRGPDKTKHMRIASLVPRIEWSGVLFAGGLDDLELELLTFPRGEHDDLIDSLSSISEIVYYPSPVRRKDERLNPNHPDYERQFIRNLHKRERSS